MDYMLENESPLVNSLVCGCKCLLHIYKGSFIKKD